MDAANVRVLRDAGRKKESGNGKKNKKNKKSDNGKNKKKKNKSVKRNKNKKNSKSAKRNKNKKNSKSAKRNKNKKNSKSAKRNNKKGNKSAKSKNKKRTKLTKIKKKTAKSTKNNSRWTANCGTAPISLLVEVAKKYQTAQNQLKKALRINRFYSTAEKKKEKARTTFNQVTREIIK